MGARGPGARPRQGVQHGQPVQLEAHPWDADGLTRAERVIAFIESLPITKGYGAGERVKLLPFQREWIEAVYATDEHGNRRVRTGLMSVARGQGKTVLAALLTLCHLCGPEAEQRGECYSAAATKEQAGLIFGEMEAVILETPWMAERLNIQRFYKLIEDSDVLLRQAEKMMQQELSHVDENIKMQKIHTAVLKAANTRKILKIP